MHYNLSSFFLFFFYYFFGCFRIVHAHKHAPLHSEPVQHTFIADSWISIFQLSLLFKASLFLLQWERNSVLKSTFCLVQKNNSQLIFIVLFSSSCFSNLLPHCHTYVYVFICQAILDFPPKSFVEMNPCFKTDSAQ